MKRRRLLTLAADRMIVGELTIWESESETPEPLRPGLVDVSGTAADIDGRLLLGKLLRKDGAVIEPPAAKPK